ncbi:alpha/beta hydrolase family protein [Herbihabitans rhizosphaerae]|uniref:Alpha/beta hydrolase family protein n=1 Tax=Herbihabitans rhizosphaerae TaxID=1872711 RepID=A0A4Q7KQJ8_9PSEU|nr:alpha/beta fold hydrolase [Herbihabitans rhizosphaerae]RZS37592.1 alpha/beta hydrolase family protein [Herbihabitans rhizosphaerae]
MSERSRRAVLRTATALGAAGAAAAAGAGSVAATPKRRGVTTFVFVSGASGSAGSGSNELAMLGHRSVGVELPGHAATDGQFRLSYQAPQDLEKLATEPSPMAGVTLDDYVAATVDTVRTVAEHGPVILIGGSMGGATITRTANEVPHLIDRLVYSSAFCCTKLRAVIDYLTTPQGSTSLLPGVGGGIGDPAVLGASRTNWRSADPGFLTRLKAALMAEATDAEFHHALASLVPDESIEVPFADARGHAETWGRVPRTYIRHTLDRSIPLALQDLMIEHADALTPHNRFDVHTVATTHVPHVAGWREILRILDELARC